MTPGQSGGNDKIPASQEVGSNGKKPQKDFIQAQVSGGFGGALRPENAGADRQGLRRSPQLGGALEEAFP